MKAKLFVSFSLCPEYGYGKEVQAEKNPNMKILNWQFFCSGSLNFGLNDNQLNVSNN